MRRACAFSDIRLILTCFDPVAQLVEHLTFNQVAAGSTPARISLYLARHARSSSRALAPLSRSKFVFAQLRAVSSPHNLITSPAFWALFRFLFIWGSRRPLKLAKPDLSLPLSGPLGLASLRSEIWTYIAQVIKLTGG